MNTIFTTADNVFQQPSTFTTSQPGFIQTGIPVSQGFGFQQTQLQYKTPEQTAKEETAEYLFNNVVEIPETRDAIGRLMFIMNQNEFQTRKQEVVQLLRHILTNSIQYGLQSLLHGSDIYLQKLSMQITDVMNALRQQGKTQLDYTRYNQPFYDATQPIHTAVNSTVTSMQPGITLPTAMANQVAQPAVAPNVADHIQAAIRDLKRMIDAMGFTDIDNSKKLKKLYEKHFLPKYKKYANILFSDIWTALQA